MRQRSLTTHRRDERGRSRALAGKAVSSAARGFTLTELVVILLLIGILAVAAFARMDSMRVFGQRSEYDSVRSALQFARKQAIAKRRYVCVQTAANGLTLTLDIAAPEATSPAFSGSCPFGAALDLPQAGSGCAANALCLTETSLTASAAAFQFDALGRAAATVTVTVSGYPPVTVEGETGLVY
jgi:MSHA pilin protein MshC